MPLHNLLDRDRTVARPGFNRWKIPPAALAVHLCIGEIYGYSVFNGPLTTVVGITRSIKGRDWTIPEVGWIYSIALIMLGLSAAILGRWVERVGARKTIFASACCFCGGLWVSSLGISLHNIWLVYLGYGVIGGIGLGLGYIAPVSTLVKWFPDRPGLATGLAIMGFGGGALIGAPLGVELMSYFKSDTSVGVKEAFLVMGGVYFAFMMFGAFTFRVPALGWLPEGYVPSATPQRLVTQADVCVDLAWKTPQFWLLWAVLCLNVTAGIGILGQASLMCQDMFGVPAAVGGGFAGLLSLSNMAGRLVWSSTSDLTGRKVIYCIFFLVGAALYALVPVAQNYHSVALFVLTTALIVSMYGGGFATIPAYLRDLFGTMHLGAIHGRLITAWSMAAVLGPQLVNYISTYRIEHGVMRAEAYNATMYLMAALLLFGLVCNLLVHPVEKRFHHREAGPPQLPSGRDVISQPGPSRNEIMIDPAKKSSTLVIVISWIIVLIPLGWGVVQSVVKSLPLFQR
jgi:MFS family permease